MKLQYLQSALEAGELIVDKGSDEHIGAHKGKLNGQYVSVAYGEVKTHDSFEALCEYLAPDADAFTNEESRWEVAAPPTPRELTKVALMVPWFRDYAKDRMHD